MTSIYAEIRIQTSKQHLWEIIANLGAISNFHPYVPKSYYVSSQKDGVGASRVCELTPRMFVQETAIRWEDGNSYTLKLDFVKGPKPPVKSLQAEMAIKESGNEIVASLMMSYSPKFGPLGWMMDRAMIRPQYTKMVPNILAGLKHYAETGELVDQGFLLRIRPISRGPSIAA